MSTLPETSEGLTAPEAQLPAQAERALARKRVEKRRGLQTNLVTYLVINSAVVLIWAMTGRGYFWPGWMIGAWGVGLVLSFWEYTRGPITDADVDAEIERIRRS